MQKNYTKEQKNVMMSGDLDLQHITLQDVIDIDFLQEFQDDFAIGMGLASVTVDPDGNPVTDPSSYTRFCDDYTHSTECGDKRCDSAQRLSPQSVA